MEVYSYHTFILPLIWKSENKQADSFEAFTKCFADNPAWVRTDPPDEHSFSPSEPRNEFYQAYQYYYPQVRGALYGFENNVVQSYSFLPDRIHGNSFYHITKGKRTYILNLNAIRLKIYNTGIALFVMECENPRGTGQDDLASVKSINEYGRRVTLPFIPGDAADSICADCLELKIPDMHVICTDYRAFIERCRDNAQELTYLNYLTCLVKDVLSYKSGYAFSSVPVGQADQIYIRPAIDDRMFVACVVGDETVAKELSAADPDNAALEQRIYEFAFIDREGCCSCQSSRLRKTLLADHLYLRWIDYGTVYGVTSHAMTMLCDGVAKNDHAPLSFLTIYIRMICLCLAQRASLIRMQQEISELSVKVYKKRNIDSSAVTQLMNLQERYSAFESQLLFREITAQEQGIDLYRMLQEAFSIEDTAQNVKSQLQGLNEAVDTDFNHDLNQTMFAMTIFGVIFGFAELLSWFLTGWIIPVCLIAVCVMIAIYYGVKRLRRKK